MKRLPRWVVLWGSLSVPLLYPAKYVVSCYVSAQKYYAAIPGIEANLAKETRVLREGHLRCVRHPKAGQKDTLEEVATLYSRINDGRDRFGRATDSLTDESDAVLEYKLDVTRGVEAMLDAWSALGDFTIGRYVLETYCNMTSGILLPREEEEEANRDPAELAAIERKGEQKMREDAVKLEEFRQMFVAARKEHDERKLLFDTIAWSVMIFEAVGMCFLVAWVRWAQKARRAAKQEEEGGAAL